MTDIPANIETWESLANFLGKLWVLRRIYPTKLVFYSERIKRRGEKLVAAFDVSELGIESAEDIKDLFPYQEIYELQLQGEEEDLEWSYAKLIHVQYSAHTCMVTLFFEIEGNFVL